MTTRTNFVGLSLALAGFFAVNQAKGQLAGNVFPNPTLSTAAAPGVDQVYSYYNGNYQYGTGPYTPSTTGDSNPRPAGWHRGGVDFGTTSTPQMLFYIPAESGVGNEKAPPSSPPSGYALEINDQDRNNYGEWFSDFDPLPAASSNGGVPIHVQFFWAYTGLNTTNGGGDSFRVSVGFSNATGDNSTTQANPIGNSVDDNISISRTSAPPDLTTFTEVDEIINVPAGDTSYRITIDSGGSSQAEGQIYVDNISVAAVPEPASLGLVGAGAMLLGARRRRRA